jgi:precorrin-6B methylase 1
MTPAEIEAALKRAREAEERAKEATPGPWKRSACSARAKERWQRGQAIAKLKAENERLREVLDAARVFLLAPLGSSDEEAATERLSRLIDQLS